MDNRFDFYKAFKINKCPKCNNEFKLTENLFGCIKCIYNCSIYKSMKYSHLNLDLYDKNILYRFEFIGNDIEKYFCYYVIEIDNKNYTSNKKLILEKEIYFEKFTAKDFVDFAFKLYENKEFI